MLARSGKPGLWRRGLASLVDRIAPLPFLAWFFPEWIVVVVLYHLLCDASAERRSFGRALCRMRVVSIKTGATVEKCAWWQAALRRAGFAASQAAWCLMWLHPEWLPYVLAYELLSLASVAIDPLGRRPEDFLAGTRVVTERAYRRARERTRLACA
jgi:uncharacterized RDD family membrane protein YckC